MAKIIAKKDEAAKYAYFASGDGFILPEDVRFVLRRNQGDFNDSTKEWRVPLHHAAGVIASIRVGGHTVVLVDAQAPKRKVSNPHVDHECSEECRRTAVPMPAEFREVFEAAKKIGRVID
jgi:hypothetical protein